MKVQHLSIYLLFVVFFGSQIQKTTAQDSLDQQKIEYITIVPSIMLESRPYAPVSATTLSQEPNVVFGVECIFDSIGTSITYLKSMSYDTSGRYDGFFLVQKFKVLDQQFKAKVIHFADLKFKELGLTVFALEALGGKKVQWSLQTSYFAYQNRSRRWIINPSLTYKQFTVGSWVYHEFGNWSLTMGVQWKSPKLAISDKYQMQVQAIYNDSWTKRWERDGFGQANTASIGVILTPKKDE
jgi:hypothetical protein